MYDAVQILDTLVAYLEVNYEVVEQEDLERIIPQIQEFSRHHFGEEYLTTKYPQLMEIIKIIE